MFIFDMADEWAPALNEALRKVLPKNIGEIVAATQPQYIEDSCKALLAAATNRQSVIGGVESWLSSQDIAAFHGTRLTAAEADGIKINGLQKLRAEDREPRLGNILSRHPRWPTVKSALSTTINAFGSGNKGGQREGQVHLTLSRAGLVEGFNHYLLYGSEFDYHVTHALLGVEGQNLLADYGTPRVVTVRVPGAVALKVTNRYGLDPDGIPNLVREVLEVWSFRFALPGYSPLQLQTDCGLVFDHDVPAEWIVGIEEVDEAPLNLRRRR
jgi:hypothetical protein